MPYYCVQSRSTTGPMQTYWTYADSPATARALVALNVFGAATARDNKLFDCFEDDTKTPPLGMIYSDIRGPIPVMILGWFRNVGESNECRHFESRELWPIPEVYFA
jgi:hypothetical protein